MRSAAALDELIADPAERQRLGAGALEAAKAHYSWDEIGAEDCRVLRAASYP